MRLLNILFFFILTTLSVSAQSFGQLYEADNLDGDSIQVSPVGQNEDAAIMIANGETLRLMGMDGKTAIVEYAGTQYLAPANSLRFIADNEAGEGNVVQDEELSRYHSALGHFFHSSAPLIVIFLLLLAAGVLMLKVVKTETMADTLPWLSGLIGVMVGASFLEIMMMVFTSDIVWWCDSKSFWKSFLMLFPVVLALGIQLYVGFGIKGKLEEISGNPLSLKTALLSIPLAFVLTLVTAIMHFGSAVQAIVFLGILGICIFYSWFKNGRGLGAGVGLAYTIFNFIYVIGAIIAAVVLVIILWRMFLILLPYLLMGVAAVAAFAFMSSKEGSASDSQPTRLFYDEAGNAHYYSADRDRANKQIAERKLES